MAQMTSDGHEPQPDVELVPVYRAANAALTALVQSLLEAENIQYMVRGDNLQDLFGWGRIGAGYNVVVGPTEFWVRADDAERAAELLKDLESS